MTLTEFLVELGKIAREFQFDESEIGVHVRLDAALRITGLEEAAVTLTFTHVVGHAE